MVGIFPKGHGPKNKRGNKKEKTFNTQLNCRRRDTFAIDYCQVTGSNPPPYAIQPPSPSHPSLVFVPSAWRCGSRSEPTTAWRKEGSLTRKKKRDEGGGRERKSMMCARLWLLCCSNSCWIDWNLERDRETVLFRAAKKKEDEDEEEVEALVVRKRAMLIFDLKEGAEALNALLLIWKTF